MKKYLVVSFAICSFLATAQNNEVKRTIIVSNPLAIERNSETVSLSKKDLKLNKSDKLEHFGIKEKGSDFFLITQVVDENLDGEMDVILVQPSLASSSSKTLELVLNNSSKQDSLVCYSRFVPERTDDYAWENNKVAFRTYGPRAQEMIEKNIKGGTLSSGIDAWLKKVEYPIINKWYEKTVSGKGSYHKDTGEGLDNFHVGNSRGIGGTAVKIDSVYYISKNFTSYKIITTGPLRTSFILTYPNWDANGKKITETKTISLDKGSYLSKFEITVSGTPELQVGLTLHDKKGTIGTSLKEGWLSYWESLDDSEIGTGVVVPNNRLKSYNHYVTTTADLSNLYGTVPVKNNKVLYYAGFGWKKGSPFQNQKEWEAYLKDFAQKVNAPITIKTQN
jgi:hypothetical protein